MKNENYSPISKLKSIPLPLQASVLPKSFLRPRSLRFRRRSSPSFRFSVSFGSAEAFLQPRSLRFPAPLSFYSPPPFGEGLGVRLGWGLAFLTPQNSHPPSAVSAPCWL